MKIFVRLLLLVAVASVSFTSCSKKLTAEEVQQINTAKKEATEQYGELKEVQIQKADTENKLEVSKKERFKRNEEKKKLRVKLGYSAEETEADKSAPAPAEESTEESEK